MDPGSNPHLGEFELIRRYFMRQGTPDRAGVVLGIGDDAALLNVPAGSELVVAVDTIVLGTHFLATTDPKSIGHRSLAVNLSDMAAMGATPAWATLALTMPSADPAWLEAFSAGFLDLARAHDVVLVGGDTTRGSLTVSVQILGHVPRGEAMRREGASAGDLIVVTGTLGDSGAGLAFASKTMAAGDQEAVAALIRRFDFPEPRVKFGIEARCIASAAMDVSDGLTSDLPKLAAASGVAAHVWVEKLPLSASLRRACDAVQGRNWALSAGDDYELLLCVAPQFESELQAAAARANLTLTVIGCLSAGTGVTWSLNGAEYLPVASGYDHFGRASTQITV